MKLLVLYDFVVRYGMVWSVGHFGLKGQLESIHWQGSEVTESDKSNAEDGLTLDKNDRQLVMKAVLHGTEK